MISKPSIKTVAGAWTAFATMTQFIVAHGLGVMPKIAYVEFICDVAEGGYSVGNIVRRPDLLIFGVNNVNVDCYVAAGVSIYQKDTYVAHPMVLANWRFRVVCFA